VVLHVAQLEINEDEAAEDAVIENKIDAVMGVVQRDAVLSTDEGEAFAEFQEEGLEVIAETGFKVGFGEVMRLGDFQKRRILFLSAKLCKAMLMM
jgi:hypothetical protein